MATLHHSAARITPAVLQWALDRAESTPAKLAKATGTNAPVVERWLSGDKNPTFRQAQEAAKHLRVPFGFMFLPEPPPAGLPIPDFRTLAGQTIGEASIDLRDVVLATLRRQAWLSEYRKEEDEARVGVVGCAKKGESWRATALDIRSQLGLRDAFRPTRQDEFLRDLTERAEALGVYVIRSGVVANNTHRPLDVKEFRGFCLSDPFAPFIFINGADVRSAQAFTLVHELAHVWMGETGVSGPLTSTATGTEAQCNRIAAEVLVPEQELFRVWDGDADIPDAVAAAARHFRVSRYVLAIKAWQSNLISQPVLGGLLKDYRREDRGKEASGSGGDFYKTAVVRNSRSFSERLMDALSRQRVLTRDAAGLLELRTKSLDGLARELVDLG